MSFELEKFIEETKTVERKVNVCPRCSNNLEDGIDIKNNLVECPACGFTIKITSKHNRTIVILQGATLFILIFFLGYFVGSIATLLSHL